MDEHLVAGVCNHVRETLVIDPLPISSECGSRHISNGCQVEGLCGNWSADADEVSLSSKEHGNETGLAHPSWSMDQELVIAVRYETFLKGSLEDFFSWSCDQCL